MTRFLNVLPWVINLSMWGLAALQWSSLPDVMPVHWDLYGEPDRWGSRAEAALVLPAVLTALLGLFAVLPGLTRSDTSAHEMRAGITQKQQIGGSGIGASVAGSGLLPLRAIKLRSHSLRCDFSQMSGVWALFRAAMAVVMGKIRPNRIFGIRTPWTLTSKRSWTRTHRIGGFGFLGGGLATAIAGLVSPQAGGGAMLLGLALLVPGLVFLSWREWRLDTERV